MAMNRQMWNATVVTLTVVSGIVVLVPSMASLAASLLAVAVQIF